MIDRASKSGDKMKILCRNSYERRFAHQYAQEKGLTCRSIIDYRKIHVNQKITLYNDCDEFEIIIWGTPQSFVEINNGMEKEVYGNPEMIPSPDIYYRYATGLQGIKQMKERFKRDHEDRVRSLN